MGAAPITQSVETSLLRTLSYGPRVHGNMAVLQREGRSRRERGSGALEKKQEKKGLDPGSGFADLWFAFKSTPRGSNLGPSGPESEALTTRLFPFSPRGTPFGATPARQRAASSSMVFEKHFCYQWGLV